MQNLRVISEETVGVIQVMEDCQFNKINADKVIIGENITVRLFGTVKSIVIKKGAKLFFHGIISGTVKNNGGKVYIF